MTVSGSVLVLGAGSGIARAALRAYGERHRPLILAGRDVAELERDAVDYRLRFGVEVRVVAFDILDLAIHASLLADLEPAPTTIICAVGLLGDQARAEQDAAVADTIMRSNFNGPALFLDAAVERMAASGGGTIIGISSVAGDRGRGSNYIYGSAKAGFTAYLSGLRNRMARRSVHVVTVKPGFVRTRMTDGVKLPPIVTAEAAEVGSAILRAEERRRNVVYVRPVWWLIMAIIRAIPEAVFKRMSL